MTWKKQFEECASLLRSDKLGKWAPEFLEDLYEAFKARMLEDGFIVRAENYKDQQPNKSLKDEK